jgi:hypothetical protein
MKSSVSWHITLCRPLKINWHFRGTCQAKPCMPSVFTLVSSLAYSSTLKMEATCSSKTSVDFQWATQQMWLVRCMQLFWTLSMDHGKENITPVTTNGLNIVYCMEWMYLNTAIQSICVCGEVSVFFSCMLHVTILQNHHTIYVERWRKCAPDDTW